MKHTIETVVLTPTTAHLQTVAKELQQGDVVGMPTETVYGLAANALDDHAVRKIFAVKGRPSDNPLIVHISSLAQLQGVVSTFGETAKKLSDAFWPGPLTMVLPKAHTLCETVTAGLQTVGVRMPDHPTALAMIEAAGLPLAAPSANLSGKPSPTTAQHVYDDLKGKLSYIVDGGTATVGLESTVVLVQEDAVRVLRPGGVTVEQLQTVVQTVVVDPAVLTQLQEGQQVTSPGMKYKHYAPKAQLTMVEGSLLEFCLYAKEHPADAVLVFDGEEVFFSGLTFCYGSREDAESQAEALFSALREIDQTDCGSVLVRMPLKTGVGMAVYNRLLRACGFRTVRPEHKRIVGLTGPTGSGKSVVATLFAERYGTVLDCDHIAKEARNLPSVQAALADAFGQDLLQEGVLNTQLLAVRAFAEPHRHATLNGIMYPAITALLLAKTLASTDHLLLMDAPTLFESGVDRLCADTIAVLAPKELRRQRVMARDGLTEEQMDVRMGVQHEDGYYSDRANHVLQNDNDRSALLQRAGELFDNIKATQQTKENT